MKTGSSSHALGPRPGPPPHRRTTDLPEERKLVTVMFADIAGFTGLAETMDPEPLRDLMNACFDTLVPVVTQFGGIVDKFIGDEIMALFGTPIAHENDAERALRAALRMQEAITAFNTAHGTDLGAHFGVNTGLVITGSIGGRNRQDYSVMGDAVNLAARLGRSSQRGEILAGAETYRHTSQLFEFQALGPLRVKGKSEPILVYKLLGLRTQPGPVRGLAARGISSPLVGRDREAVSFLRMVDRVMASQGGLVSILGDAGMGKSRLVAEVRRRMDARDIFWLEGCALSFSQNISFWPFLEIIHADAGITIADEEEVRWAKLEHRFHALFPDETVEILPYIGTLLTLNVPAEWGGRIQYLDGETMKRQIFRSARRFFTRLAKERPLVLVFEDVQWADHSSISLLEHLLPLVREVPLLICMISRRDRGTPADRLREIAARIYADCFLEITLPALSSSASAQLIQNLLKIGDLPPPLIERIQKKAEGNPFFIEEMIRELIDLGVLGLDKATSRWQVTAEMERVTIPDTLHGVLVSRLDRLDEEVKQVLKLAAVIGRIFFHRVLKAVAEAEKKLDHHLAELQNLEIIREKSRTPELEYIFQHALMQEAAYESILLQRRRELHRRVAECIEILFPDRLDEFYGLLAYHYSRAEQWQKAQEYLFKAGDQAGKVAADAEALEHYRQALAAYARAFGDRWDPFQRAVLERKMGEALFRRGENSLAREYLLRALISLGSPYPTSARGVRLAIGKQIILQAWHHLLPRVFWEKQKGQINHPAEERCRIYSIMAWMDYFMDPERLVLDSLLELNLAEKNNLPVQAVLASMGVGLVCDALPSPRLARHYHARAVALAEQTRQPLAAGQAYFGLALHEHHALGEGKRALAHYQRSTAAYWEAGHLRRWAGVNMAASFLWLQINYTNRLKIAQEVVRHSQDAADHQAWGWGLFMMATALDQAGALDEAVTDLHRAIELAKGVPDHQVTVYASGILARCYLRQGNLESAFKVLEESIQRIRSHRLRGFSCVPVWVSLAQAYLIAAEQAEESVRADVLKSARRACRVALKQGKFDRASRVAAFRMQGTYEWLRHGPKPAQKWWQRSMDLAEELGARYEAGLTHLEIGKYRRDPAHLKQAQAIFEAMGAKFDLEKAKEVACKPA